MDRPLPQQKLQLTRVTCYLPSLPASTTGLGVELAIGVELSSPLLHRNHELVHFLWTCHFRELFFFFFLLRCQAALQSVLTLVRQIKGFTVSERQIPFSLDFSLCLRKFNALSCTVLSSTALPASMLDVIFCERSPSLSFTPHDEWPRG